MKITVGGLRTLIRQALTEGRSLDVSNQLSALADTGAFVTYTSVDKLGINPQSVYNTPLAIFSYPLDSEFVRMFNDNEIRFAHDQPHIQVFRPVDPSRVLSSDTFSELDLKRYAAELEALGVTDVKNVLESETARVQTPLGKFWYLTKVASETCPVFKRSNKILGWNGVFRALGIDGVIDNGFGIIHPNERKQAAFFSTGALRHIASFKNPTIEVRARRFIRSGLIQKNVDRAWREYNWLIGVATGEHGAEDPPMKGWSADAIARAVERVRAGQTFEEFADSIFLRISTLKDAFFDNPIAVGAYEDAVASKK